jgi:hypothetical protein
MKLLQKLFRQQQRRVCHRTPDAEEILADPRYWARRGYYAANTDCIPISHRLHYGGPGFMLTDVATHLLKQAFPGIRQDVELAWEQDHNEDHTGWSLNNLHIKKSGLTIEELQSVFFWRRVREYEYGEKGDAVVVLPEYLQREDVMHELFAGIAEKLGIHQTLSHQPRPGPLIIMVDPLPPEPVMTRVKRFLRRQCGIEEWRVSDPYGILSGSPNQDAPAFRPPEPAASCPPKVLPKYAVEHINGVGPAP